MSIGFPVAIVANLFRIEHQRAIGPGAGDVTLQARLGDDLPVAFGQFLAEFVHVRVILAGEHFAERGQTRRHRNRIGVVSAAVKDFVLRNQIHDGLVRQKAASGKPPPIDFARQIMSGFTPKYSEAPPQPSFAPVFTSSKISNAPFLVADLAQSLQKARLRHAQADVHQDRLEDDGRDLARILLEAQLDGGQIVEGRNQHIGDRQTSARRARREPKSER